VAERAGTRRRGLIPDLPRQAWIILGGDALSAVGNGLVLPFFIIYLNRVRGLDIDTAAYALATTALVGFVVGPIGGWMSDRFGARRIVILSLVVSALGSISIALVRETWHAFAAAGLFGSGITLFWPSVHALVTTIVAKHQRSAVFSVHYAAINLGIGIGGLLGGFMVDTADASTFELVYYLDALTFVPFIFMLVFFVRNVGGAVRPDAEATGIVAPSYLSVLRDKRFLRVLTLMTLLVTIGYGQLEASFPAFATRPGGISTRALGATFAANTFFIVVAQLLVLRWLDGRRRTRAIVVLALLWAACWGTVLFGGTLGSGMDATVVFAFAAVLFAFGETIVSPTLSPMVQDLATDQTRGRYSAVFSMTWMVGSVIGPAIAGFFLDIDKPGALFTLLMAACIGAGWMAYNLEKHIPDDANLVRLADEEETELTAPEAAGVEVAG
jgi:MFS family permease